MASMMVHLRQHLSNNSSTYLLIHYCHFFIVSLYCLFVFLSYYTDHPQLPTMSGGVLHKDTTLHDPIVFESEGAVKHSDLLWDQANSEIWSYTL